MPQILKTGTDLSEDEVFTRAAAIVSQGGVIAYPTETIYGLGTDATDEQAIRRIFDIKGRNFNNPISVIIGNHEDVFSLIRNVPMSARKLMDAFWPGPLTIVFAASDSVSPLITAGTGKIGIRLSGHWEARMIAQKTGRPITATSANLSGEPECMGADQVIRQLGDRIDAVVDLGETGHQMATTIVDATEDPPAILRLGAITPEDILQKTGIIIR